MTQEGNNAAPLFDLSDVEHRVGKLEGATLDGETVKRFAREALASYKVPRRVLFFSEEELNLTGSAKIRAAEMRRLAIERLARENA